MSDEDEDFKPVTKRKKLGATISANLSKNLSVAPGVGKENRPFAAKESDSLGTSVHNTEIRGELC